MGFNKVPTLIALALAALIWLLPVPEGVSVNAWHLLAMFVGIIAAIIGKAMPIGAIAIIAFTLVALTGVTVVDDKAIAAGKTASLAIKDALSALNHSLIWMIGIAIIISRGLLKTGLGERIGYLFVSLWGKRAIGVAYSLSFCDLLLGPVTPSNTARGGAIVHPIMKSIAGNFGSDPADGTQKKIGRYLALVNYHSNIITCLFFVTATAPNPLAVDAINKLAGTNFQMSWGSWFVGMCVPALVAMLLMPLILMLFFPPEIKRTPDAPALAREKLKAMGPMNRGEKIMLGVFAVMLLLWAEVPKHLFGVSVDATAAALLGLSLLLISGVLTWDDALKEKGAWDTIIWFAALVMMADFLNRLGLIGWISNLMKGYIASHEMSWQAGSILLVLVYLYSHYMFASGTAHVTGMFAAFYGAGLALGAPPALLAFAMSAATGIMMSLTHYASGSSPVIFSSNYVTLKEWWLAGFIMSVVEIAIFATVGLAWWKMLGY